MHAIPERECRRTGRSTSVENAKVFAGPYLRAAQAYMLISMPTGTSTIFGVFQDILVSLCAGRFFVLAG